MHLKLHLVRLNLRNAHASGVKQRGGKVSKQKKRVLDSTMEVALRNIFSSWCHKN